MMKGWKGEVMFYFVLGMTFAFVASGSFVGAGLSAVLALIMDWRLRG